jgi:hypothetical protein
MPVKPRVFPLAGADGLTLVINFLRNSDFTNRKPTDKNTARSASFNIIRDKTFIYGNENYNPRF